MSQPTMTSDHGVVASIGIVVNHDRCEIVLPIASDHAYNSIDLCSRGLEAVIQGIVPNLQACLSPNAEITFVAAEGMDDGKIPFRSDFVSGTYPGTLTGASLPSNVAALLVLYEDPDDVAPGHRLRVARNFIPGVPETQVVGDIIQNTLYNALVSLTSVFGGGFQDLVPNNWYRVLAAPRPRGTGVVLKRIAAWGPRNYVGTQRRRLLPHY